MAKHRGRGVATINYPIGMNLGGDPSQALVHSNPSGKFTVALSSIDLGQGMKSVTRRICAETLGVRLARNAPRRQRRDGRGARGARGHDGSGGGRT
jgi:CO/xanthine dehydrogenase Mo-binding subunit